MPQKSRRNRRHIPQNRGTFTPKAPDLETVPGVEAQPVVRSTPSYSGGPRSTASLTPVYPYISSELRWIAIVTVIVAIVLIVAYYIFR